jgi:hypothetical protein
VDIGRAIQFVFKDPNWIKKILIGGVMLIIPIIGWLIAGGYYLRTVQGVIRGVDSPLPEWDDWGGDLVRGLKVLGAVIIWFIPVWVLQICVMMLGIVDDGFATGALSVLFSCVIFILAIAITFLLPLIVSRVARTENITDAFQFGDIFQEAQRIPAQLLIYVVMAFVVQFVAGFGIILCLVGVFFTAFIGYLITGHLVGQIRRILDGTGPLEPVPTPEPPPAA